MCVVEKQKKQDILITKNLDQRGLDCGPPKFVC